jgi:hypothetical protein
LFWEKSTAGWLLAAGLLWEKSTVGWWLISQTNRLLHVTLVCALGPRIAFILGRREYVIIDLCWHIENRLLAHSNWQPSTLWCRHNAGGCKTVLVGAYVTRQHIWHNAGGAT